MGQQSLGLFSDSVTMLMGKVVDRCKENNMETCAMSSFAIPARGTTYARRVTFSYRNNLLKRPLPILLHSQIVNDKKFNGSMKQLVNGIYGCISVNYINLQRLGTIPR